VAEQKNTIAILDTGYDSYEYETNLLEENGYQLQIFDGAKDDDAGKLEFARDATGIFIRWTVIDQKFLEQCPELKVIVRYGVGYDNIDLNAVNRAGVKVAIVRGYANHSVSDHALALMYGCARGLALAGPAIKTQFGKPPFEPMIEFHDKTLGIIGMGRIGGTLASKTVHLFNNVLASDPYLPDSRFEELAVQKSTLDSLLENSDVISVHCNLTKETYHLVDNNAFNKMKKIAILINTARGPIVHTPALLEALADGKLHSAGLDVFDTEIPEEIPETLLTNHKIITTGHYAWYSENAMAELQRRAALNMIALLHGEKIEDCLNDIP